MLVEIIQQNGVSIFKKLKMKGNKVLITEPKLPKMGKPTRKSIGESAEFTTNSVIREKRGFFNILLNRKVDKVVMMEGADKCITYFNGNVNEADIPTVDKATIQRYADEAGIQIAGQAATKLELPMGFYFSIIIVMVLNVLVLLVASGRLKL